MDEQELCRDYQAYIHSPSADDGSNLTFDLNGSIFLHFIINIDDENIFFYPQHFPLFFINHQTGSTKMRETVDRAFQKAEAERLLQSIHSHGTLNQQSAPLKPIQKKCPTCGKPMLRRTSKKASAQNSQFWGCSGYPTCKTVIPIVST